MLAIAEFIESWINTIDESQKEKVTGGNVTGLYHLNRDDRRRSGPSRRLTLTYSRHRSCGLRAMATSPPDAEAQEGQRGGLLALHRDVFPLRPADVLSVRR